MNLSSIVYIGKQEPGNGRVVRQLIQNMEDADNPAWWAYYINKAIEKEKEQGIIDPLDETQVIRKRMDEIMHRKGMKDVFVGSIHNQQAGLQCPEHLSNLIFKKNIILLQMWQWICDHFLNLHTESYDWFGLLRYLADNQMLDNGMCTTNTRFAKQMNEWFPSYVCKSDNVKVYRTGYLGNKPYKDWNQSDFEKQIRSNQRIDGFVHLNNICNVDLTLANEEDPLDQIIKKESSKAFHLTSNGVI